MRKRITALCIMSAVLLSGCNGETPAETTAAVPDGTTSAVVAETPETTPAETTQAVETTVSAGKSEPVLHSYEKETEDGWLYYVWDDNGVMKAYISGYNGTDTDLVIPDYAEGYPVTNVNSYSFTNNESITSVVFPDTIEIIDSDAFRGCINLGNVTIPETIKKISADSFEGTPWFEKQCAQNDIVIIGNVLLRAVNVSGDYTVPDNIDYIADWAFDECEEITSVTIPDNVTGIGAGAFSQCYRLTSVTLPSSITKLEYAVFGYCYQLDNVVIPDSVTDIDSDAFSGCDALKNLTIPETVTYIGKSAFEDTIWLAEKQAENPLVVVNGILIDGMTASGDFTIPENVTRIGAYAFWQNENITSVTIPESVTEIGEYAFDECINLKSVSMADSVKLISSRAFSDCSSLEKISFSKNLTELHYGVFHDCPKLTGFTIPDELDIDIFVGMFGTLGEEYPVEAVYKGNTWVYNHEIYGFENAVQSAER